MCDFWFSFLRDGCKYLQIYVHRSKPASLFVLLTTSMSNLIHCVFTAASCLSRVLPSLPSYFHSMLTLHVCANRTKPLVSQGHLVGLHPQTYRHMKSRVQETLVASLFTNLSYSSLFDSNQPPYVSTPAGTPISPARAICPPPFPTSASQQHLTQRASKRAGQILVPSPQSTQRTSRQFSAPSAL